MTGPEKITLGDKIIEVKPLKLGQLRGLLDALDAMQGKTGGPSIDAAADVLVVGLPGAELSRDIVLDLDASLEELNAAVAIVIRVAGRLKPVQSGEAMPVAPAA